MSDNVPVRTVSKSLRAMFTQLDDAGITQKALAHAIGACPKNISRYRLGQATPTLLRFEEMVEALGYEIRLTPIRTEVRE